MLKIREVLTRIMRPEFLLSVIMVIVILIVLVVMVIYLRLYIKKRAFFYKEGIRSSVDTWISEIIFSEQEEELSIPEGFHLVVRNPMGRQYVIDALVNCKRSFTGIPARKITDLYESSGLKKSSLDKLGSTHWYVKARGIQELYMMDQSDVLKRIYKSTNDRNEYIRMEAQTGLIHLYGFEGLRFLDVISYPLTEWQQLKLLDRLGMAKMNIRLSDSIPRWLKSDNESVVIFALRLTEEYQQLAMQENVSGCLQHPAEIVRRQAIHTLMRIADEGTAGRLADAFEKETFDNRIAILEALSRTASEDQAPFLTRLLDNENSMIRLKAAKALAINSGSGLAVLAEKSRQQPDPYMGIYLHVKAETSL